MIDDRLKDELQSSFFEIDSNVNKSLFNIALYGEFGSKLGKLYSIIDDDYKFSKIIEEFSNKEISFPDVEEFKSSLMTTIIYYYKEIMGFSWKKIQEILPYERDLSLRYGTKIKRLNKNIKSMLNNLQNN